MPHNHEHCCEHDVRWCKICDVVYCKKCGKEWRQYAWTYTYPNYALTGTTTSGSTYIYYTGAHTHAECQ